MAYFKDKNKKASFIDDSVSEVMKKKLISNFGLIEIDEAEFNDLKSLSFEQIVQEKKDLLLGWYTKESTKSIPYKEVLYKGGDASAGAISGAVTLAQSLSESNVKIIASDDSANDMTFNEALELSGLIAKAWRTAFFRYKELKIQISNASTVEELEAISWEEM